MRVKGKCTLALEKPPTILSIFITRLRDRYLQAVLTIERGRYMADKMIQGFGCAVGFVIRDHGLDSVGVDAMKNCGIDYFDLVKAGVEEFDLAPIRRALGIKRNARPAKRSSGQGSHNTTNYSIGLCAKKVPLYCASFDPASKNCEECELRPTA